MVFAVPEPAEERVENDYAIRVEEVAKRFGSIQALDGVSFSVNAGERIALLGPNGAGKTSLVRAICGRVRVDRGEINLFGHPPSAPEAKGAIGFIPQELAIYQDLTARENLQAFGRFYHLRGSALRNKIDWALEWIGLEDRQHDLIRTFSGGMKRRINIACSCLHDPKLLVLDEPTVGVDPQSRERIYAMLGELHQRGTSLLWTTHLMSEAEANSDRIIVIDHGKKIADGNLEALAKQTLGYGQRIEMQIEGEMKIAPNHLVWDSSRDRWVGIIEDIGRELPHVLQAVSLAGGHVSNVQVRIPNLDDIFMTLTGRELRE